MAGACRDSTPFPRAREQRNTPCVGFWTCPVSRNRVWNRLKYRQTKHYSLRLLTLWRRKITWVLYRDSVRTAQSTNSRGYTNRSAKILIGYVHFPSPAFFISKRLPCYEPTFTRKTRGHSLGTFRAAYFPDSLLPNCNKCSACHVGRWLSDVHSYQGLHIQLYSWWWVQEAPETCRVVNKWNKSHYPAASCWFI